MGGRRWRVLGVALGLAVLGLVTGTQAEGQAGVRVEGYVYVDENGDGVRTAGEAGIGGVSVQAAGGGRVVSSSSGWYAVTLPDGGGLVNFGLPDQTPTTTLTPTQTATLPLPGPTATDTPEPSLLALTPEPGQPCGWLCMEGFPCWRVCLEVAPRLWLEQ